LEKTDLINTDHEHIWHPFTSFGDGEDPLFIKEAKGVYLHTADGRKIIDAISSWWVNLHGHSHPEIASAIHQQATTLEHVIFAGFTHEPAITLTKNLLTVLPQGQQRIFFSDNGSTAVEVGVKMALQYFYNLGVQKKKIIALEGAYHGDTFGSMSVGGRSAFTAPFNDFLFDVEFIPVPTGENIHEVVQKFEEICKRHEVAAFIYEPLVQGAGGMVIYEPSHLKILMTQAKNYDVLCVADEVFTGFGRTGKWFASDHVDIKPDIMAISKGITGGVLPLGVTTCTRKIEQAFQSKNPLHTFFHGHSYTANPISCSAANASFGLLNREETWIRISNIAEAHQSFIGSIQNHPSVKDARSLGTILAIELIAEGGSSYFNAIRKRIYSYFLERDVLLRPLGNVIYVLPPYIITTHELGIIYKAISDFLDQLKSSS
jgi:adenosylmethionine---8-amino-7-oxononanoate aminotransferase